MSDAPKASRLQIELNLSHLDNDDRIQLAALIAQFAPRSVIYTADLLVKTATDSVIQLGEALDAAQADTEAKRQAYLESIPVRDALQHKFDDEAKVFKAAAQKACKTEEDIQSLGLQRRPDKGAPVELVPPTIITAQPGKEPGSIAVHALRIPGLYKYVAEISVDPITPGSFQQLPGSNAKRTLVGYVSGQRYWIRFATERGVLRSAWSELVAVIAR